MKKLDITGNKIPNKDMCDAIAAKIGIESKILNCKKKVPLTILNNFVDSFTPKGSSCFTNLFLINCAIDRLSLSALNSQGSSTMKMFSFSITKLMKMWYVKFLNFVRIHLQLFIFFSLIYKMTLWRHYNKVPY